MIAPSLWERAARAEAARDRFARLLGRKSRAARHFHRRALLWRVAAIAAFAGVWLAAFGTLAGAAALVAALLAR